MLYVCMLLQGSLHPFRFTHIPVLSVKKRISVNSLVPQNELTLLFTSSQEETLATGHHLVCFGSHIHAIYFKGHEDKDAGYIKVDRVENGTESSLFRLGD